MATVKPVVFVKACHLGGTRVESTCRAGHVWQEDLSYPKGKHYPHIRLSETAVAMLAHYWERPAKCAKKLHPTPQDRLRSAKKMVRRTQR